MTRLMLFVLIHLKTNPLKNKNENKKMKCYNCKDHMCKKCKNIFIVAKKTCPTCLGSPPLSSPFHTCIFEFAEHNKNVTSKNNDVCYKCKTSVYGICLEHKINKDKTVQATQKIH